MTGASRGLGREIALTLAKSGYNVAINYLASENEAKKAADEIGQNAFLIKADVGDARQVEEMAAAVYRKWGRVDVLVNNAGITKDSLMIKLKEAEWDEILRVNLKGCFNTIRAFSRVMIKTGGGHIVNISSYSGVKGKEGQTAYSASKAALLGLTYTAARELAGYNIRVNALLPGYMQTEMGMAAEKAMSKARADSISGSLSDPKEVAGFVEYLIKTDYITGQVFSLDSRII
ncbi:MAG: SDR family NAD(P)-dependent oxidoreductase [Thermodesulfovibrionales bacterium]|nr:SDR family NAD(P)-dependent oxidoreductase [Thermodesulfovibrionales bacterium]MDP3111277.1 SDR family NAD(P)-dependent oxidoreductase [Thermodesulfovibrionales bacterium]